MRTSPTTTTVQRVLSELKGRGWPDSPRYATAHEGRVVLEGLEELVVLRSFAFTIAALDLGRAVANLADHISFDDMPPSVGPLLDDVWGALAALEHQVAIRRQPAESEPPGEQSAARDSA